MNHIKKYGVFYIALGFGGLATILYGVNFGFGFWPDVKDWASTGDFFGGVLNPIYALLGIYLIAKTIALNSASLNQTMKEMKKTGDTSAVQRFESAFFSVLQQLNHTQQKILNDGPLFKSQTQEFPSDVELKHLNNRFFSIWDSGDFDNESLSPGREIQQLRQEFLGGSDAINSYTRLLYQLLKLIANNCPDSTLLNKFSEVPLGVENDSTHPSLNEKMYSNIVRATVSDSLLKVIGIYTCTIDRKDEFYKYRFLVERYSFLKHIQLDSNFAYSYEGKDTNYSIVSAHNIDTFDDNPKVLSMYKNFMVIRPRLHFD